MNASRSGMNVPQILTILLVLLMLGLAGWLLYAIRQTLLPFGIAFFLSYVLMPLVDRMESRGVPRMVGVLVIYAGTIALLVFLLATFVPVLGSGVADLRERVLGQRAVWMCAAANPGPAEVTVTRAESTDPDFGVDSLPLRLPPNGRDSVAVHFNPLDASPRVCVVDLIGTVEGEDDEQVLARLHLVGNGWGLELARARNAARGREGAARIGVGEAVHNYGRVEPGVLNDLRDVLAAYQPVLVKHLPMFEGLDLADELNQRVKAWTTELLQHTPALVGTVVSGMTNIVIVPIVAFFFLSEGRSIKRATIELVPNRYFEMVLNLIYRIDQQLGGYIRGLVLSVIIVSLLSITGLWTIGLRDYLVVGTLAGLSNVIPYLGPIIGIAAGILATLLQHGSLGVGVLLPVVAVFLIVQIVDNVFIQPVVVAKSVNLHPLIVIFVVLVGNHLFGPIGMLLAVPFTAVTKVSAQTIYHGLRSYSAGA
jgi:predicted PurR-regulated permease PerM